MEDIFISDPRQSSAQSIAQKQKNQKKPKRRLYQYLLDLVIKTALISGLLAIDFTLFAEAGSYNLFSFNQTLNPEAAWLYAAIAIVSFALVLLVSFSLTLQNLLVSLAAGVFLLAVFTQFALFDYSSVLASYFGHLAASATGSVLSSYSHLVLAGVVFLLTFIFLSFAKRSSQMYLLGTLLLILGAILSQAYFNPVSRVFDSAEALPDESTHQQSHNFVFIGLTNAPTYSKLRSFDPEAKNQDISQAADNVLGFYRQNNFTYYPFAYINHTGQPLLNLADSLNTGTKKAEDFLSDNVLLKSYWDFRHINNQRLYLRANKVFDTFHKNDYNLRVYQNGKIELCNINSRLSVNRCTEKSGLPLNLGELNLGTAPKTALLAAQWLESTGLIPGLNPLLGVISAFEREIVPLNFSTAELNTVGFAKTLNLIADDIATDKGNNAYFTLLDAPGNLMVYDSLCNIKPLSRWVDINDSQAGLLQRRQALAEQTSCLYGQLENFVQQLQSSGKLKNTVIVIQGLNAPLANMPGLDKEVFKSLQNSRQTGIAIFDPLKNQADIDYKLCTAPAILRNYLYKKDCSELEDFAIAEQLRQDIVKNAESQKLSGEQVKKALDSFKKWYIAWAAHNQLNNLMNQEVIPLEKNPAEPEIAPEKKIEKAPVAEVTEELAPEAATKPLSQAAEKTAQTEPSAKKDQPAKQPDKTEPQKQVNVEVKVIDNSNAQDVVPPFLLGEVKYKDAQPQE